MRHTAKDRPFAGKMDGEPLLKPAWALWIKLVERGVNQLVPECGLKQSPLLKEQWRLKVDLTQLTRLPSTTYLVRVAPDAPFAPVFWLEATSSVA